MIVALDRLTLNFEFMLRRAAADLSGKDPVSFPDHFTSTRATPFTVLVASTGLPSGVTSILRTM